MIIRNIGYMWHRKYVDWQHGENLTGYAEKGRKVVNFAYQAGIYILYDHNFNCIYLGQTGRRDTKGLYHRLKDHTEDDLFCLWERFSWFGLYSTAALQKDWKNPKEAAKLFKKEFKVNTTVNELMNVIESMLIRVHRPQFNKAIGTLLGEKDKNQIEWFYQEAEWEEEEAKFNNLKKTCKSLNTRK